MSGPRYFLRPAVLRHCRDRASYDASTSAYVVYTVATATTAPAALTFGSSFFTLAATYAGSVVIGKNTA